MRSSLVLAALLSSGCFGAVSTQRSYYVLAGDPGSRPARPAVRGTVRVANLDADAVYEKFQFVVRKNPYELRYSDTHVWAVKPNQMVADILARVLLETGVFENVIRTLGEQKPDYMLNGDLNAIEIYDSDDIWYAHLAVSLSLTRFSDGQQLWQMSYDQRKLLAERSHAQAARAISELLAAAARQAFVELSGLGLDPLGEQRQRVEERLRAEDAEDEDEPADDSTPPDEPLVVPESRQ